VLCQLNGKSAHVVDSNGARAATRAGYARGSAKVTASRLLTKANIAAAVEDALEDRHRRTEATADNAVRELTRIAFFDIGVLFDERGRLRPVTDLAPEHAAVIASIDLVTRKVGGGDVDCVHRIRLRDKVQALELLMRHLGMLDGDGAVKPTMVPAFALPADTRGVAVH
jgi:phage terminase small subunit